VRKYTRTRSEEEKKKAEEERRRNHELKSRTLSVAKLGVGFMSASVVQKRGVVAFSGVISKRPADDGTDRSFL